MVMAGGNRFFDGENGTLKLFTQIRKLSRLLTDESKEAEHEKTFNIHGKVGLIYYVKFLNVDVLPLLLFNYTFLC